MNKPGNFNDYIKDFPPQTQALLEEMRSVIRKAAPAATEVISYGMPAFKVNSVLVYFAGYKAHIGFYPTGSGIAAFSDQLMSYKSSKGAVQFPLDKPLPAALITRMVKFRVREDAEKAGLRSATRKKSAR